MNTLKNNVQLMGHLGAAPEVKTFDGGRKMARFNMATSERYKNNKGETITETYWHTVIAWGHNADFAEKFLEKGREVLINGKLVNRAYTDKSGVKRYITEVQVNDLVITSPKAA
jgi:single-strand DNA-binding protein